MDHWYLSFVNDRGFAGGCFIEADSMHEAIVRAHREQCNPGGQVLAVRMDYDDPTCTIRLKAEHFNKLYTRPELADLFGETHTLKEAREKLS